MGFVLLKNPNESWQLIETEKLTLGMMRGWVNGSIAIINHQIKVPKRNVLPYENGFSVYINADFLRNGTEYNISAWSTDPVMGWLDINGPVFICAADESTGADLPMTKQQLEYAKAQKVWLVSGKESMAGSIKL